MKRLLPVGRGRGRPLRRSRHVRTRRRWTWRSLFHAPIPHLFVLAVACGGLYALATSQVFAISRVEVVGDSTLPVDQLRETCQCLHHNIFLTSPDDIQQRLNDRIPWVQVRQVYGRLPDRIVVDAAYRQPAVLWRTTVATYAVDVSGRVLYDTQNPPDPSMTVPTTATLPIVYSPHDSRFTSGQQVDPTAVQMVLQARAGLARLAPDIAPSVDRYRWSPYSGLVGHSHLGWWFALGIFLHGELQDRLRVLVAAHQQQIMHDARCNYIDLRVIVKGNGVYCRYNIQWYGPWGP